MTHQKKQSPLIEPAQTRQSHILCWKSIAAGILISIMTYMILSALGAGMVGSAARTAIENEQNGSALATGAVLWMGLSAVISLFLGSYFAVRMAKSITSKIGVAHGFVVASIFFILLMIQAGSTVSALSRGFGHLVAGLGKGSASIASSPIVQDTINRTLGSSTLKSEPKVVAEGLAERLLVGDVESAKSYYSYQTGLSGPEVDTKIAQLKNEFQQAAKNAGDKIAKAVSDTGWSLFVVFLVGLLAALIGGRTGAHANLEHPLMETEGMVFQVSGPVLANERGGMLPYVVGWLMGVPMTILFLIFVLRSVF